MNIGDRLSNVIYLHKDDSGSVRDVARYYVIIAYRLTATSGTARPGRNIQQAGTVQVRSGYVRVQLAARPIIETICCKSAGLHAAASGSHSSG